MKIFGRSVHQKTLVAIFFCALTALSAIHLLTLTDWVSFVVDEGWTSYAAARVRAGELPHRDFFFLWTPGILWLHSLLQSWGGGLGLERMAALLASALSSALVLRLSSRAKLSAGQSWILVCLLLAWSFPLWNIAYSSWYAVLFALCAAYVCTTNIIFAGVFVALSFWFKQNIGVFAALGVVTYYLVQGYRRAAVNFLLFFLVLVLLPFNWFAWRGGWAAVRAAADQIFLFPWKYQFLMFTAPPREWFAGPVVCLGLWIISLYLVKPNPENPRAVRIMKLVVLAYLAFTFTRHADQFSLALFLLLSVMAWPLFGGLFFAQKSVARALLDRRLQALIFVSGGAFLQVYPRLDFQHFLFVFPPVALLLVMSVALLEERYPQIPKGWMRLPLFMLILCGAFLQMKVATITAKAQKDDFGLRSFGNAYQLNKEMKAVVLFLESRGLKAGAPVLVLPNATMFYYVSGFRNPTPHNQFFPGYVKGYGADPATVLTEFEAEGGRYLVVQHWSGLDKNEPELQAQIEQRYKLLKRYPLHFSVYETLKRW